MAVPISQMTAVVGYVLRQRLRGVRRYPLVLMLEPLLRCNLACPGCGKIQHPAEALRRQLTPAQCFDAAVQCGAPMISIPGGEPLLHPQIDEIVSGLVALKRFVYLCTNGLLLDKALEKLTPSKRFSLSVHIDGFREDHDRAVDREGVYETVRAAISAAVARGFRVTVNTTLFTDANAERTAEMFDDLSRLGVEGFTVSPGYAYHRAADQDHFLTRERTQKLFRELMDGRRRRWKFCQSPLYLAFLTGRWHLSCTPWGNPTYNVFGWQRPCYLLDDGYEASFAELMSQCDWSRYGFASGNPACRDCMVHCGHEPTAVAATLLSPRAMCGTALFTALGRIPNWLRPSVPIPPRDVRSELPLVAPPS